jgi:hypothetical protein
MTEMINFSTNAATPASFWGRGLEPVRNRLKPLIEVVCAGSKVLRINPVLCFLWLLFPLSLILISDWIGLLVVFQAATVAVRLRNTPAAKTLAPCSPTSASANPLQGEYRVL